MPKNATRQALAREAKSARNRSSAKKQKQKLSPAERSQIARDRWAKIRADKEKAKNTAFVDKNITVTWPDPEPKQDTPVPTTVNGVNEALSNNGPDPEPPFPPYPAAPTGRDENGVPSIVGLGDGTFTPNGTFVPDNTPQTMGSTAIVYRQNSDGSFTEISGGMDVGQGLPAAPTPAPQLAPVKAPKQKRYTGPKEFSVALKAAENRLAKAIVERAQAAGSLAALNAEIPSLLGIINALKGSGNYVPPTPPPNFVANDFPGNYFPNALSGGPNPAPQFQPVDPMDAIRAAMAQPPVSRAIGNAVQLPPDVVGTLEGPEDDEDRFITGPAAGGSGWIGG